jgi:hypothetical protein
MKAIFGYKQIPMFEDPPILPQLIPYGFFMIPKLKISLKGSHFELLGNIQNNDKVI